MWMGMSHGLGGETNVVVHWVRSPSYRNCLTKLRGGFVVRALRARFDLLQGPAVSHASETNRGRSENEPLVGFTSAADDAILVVIKRKKTATSAVGRIVCCCLSGLFWSPLVTLRFGPCLASLSFRFPLACLFFFVFAQPLALKLSIPTLSLLFNLPPFISRAPSFCLAFSLSAFFVFFFSIPVLRIKTLISMATGWRYLSYLISGYWPTTRPPSKRKPPPPFSSVI